MTGLTPRALLAATSRHRGLVAGGLAAAAVVTGLGVVAPNPAETVTVLTATRDLPGGRALSATDLHPVAVERSSAPAGALTKTGSAEGRLLTSPIRRGEILTDVRLIGAGLLRGQPDGLRAVSLRLADPAMSAVVRPGDQIDILAATTTEASGNGPGSDAPSSDAPRSDASRSDAPGRGGPVAIVVATDLTVLAVPLLADDSGEGALIVVATYPETAGRLAGVAVTRRLSAMIRPTP